MKTRITLKEAQARKFKRHDDHFNRLMAQETETTVEYPEEGVKVDYSDIWLVNKMVYVKASYINGGYPCFMVIE